MKKLIKFWTGSEGSESVEDMERETTTTKKAIMMVAMLIIHCAVFSQGYFGTSVMNKGVSATLGILADKTDINFSVQFPLTEVTVPTILSLSIGRMFDLTHNDEGNNYSITPSIGAAVQNKKESVAAGTYRKEFNISLPYESYKRVSEVLPYYSLEVGKDAYLGRVFIKGIYSREMYFGTGMRMFLNRNN